MKDTKINPTDRAFENRLGDMSPFEIKSTLINLAKDNARRSTDTLLNAGRGNPNWLLGKPRQAFFTLGTFAIEEASRQAFNPELGILASPDEEGVGTRFKNFLATRKDDPGAKVLSHFFTHATTDLGLDPDDLAFELVDGILGDHYPTPPRILKNSEVIIREYLRWAMGGEDDATSYDLFATEGGTAAMCYIFNTLQQNFLLNRGDKIALLTPCFTPYLEIPKLEEFGYEVVKISANQIEEDGYHDWQYPDSELDKLRDPLIKAVCVINPSNPPSYTFSNEALQRLIDNVRDYNPELMIITDDVYGTFIKGFKSLMYALPYNTCCIYSYSKYFGATGWRLAVMAVTPDNVFDKRLKELPADKKEVLRKRYESLALNPDSVKFVDRLVADSRLVALNHTAGLSTPQQIQMAIFSAYAYLHREELQPELIKMIHERLKALWSGTGFTLLPDPYRAGYYSEIDIMVWARKFYGDDFANYLNAHYNPLDFVIRLADETAVVLLNGDGFDGPKWSVRASLANLDKDDYLKIGGAVRRILDNYHKVYLSRTANQPADSTLKK